MLPRFVLYLPYAASVSAVLTGKVVKVADGDSITVLDNTNTQHRIRPRKNDRLRSRLRRDLEKDGSRVGYRWTLRLYFRSAPPITASEAPNQMTAIATRDMGIKSNK